MVQHQYLWVLRNAQSQALPRCNECHSALSPNPQVICGHIKCKRHKSGAHSFKLWSRTRVHFWTVQWCSSTRHNQKPSVLRFLKQLDIAMTSILWSWGPSIEWDAFLILQDEAQAMSCRHTQIGREIHHCRHLSSNQWLSTSSTSRDPEESWLKPKLSHSVFDSLVLRWDWQELTFLTGSLSKQCWYYWTRDHMGKTRTLN